MKEHQVRWNRSTLWSLIGYFIVLSGLGLGFYFVIRDFQNLNLQRVEFNLFRLLLSLLISLFSIFLAVLIWRAILQKNGLNYQFNHDLRVYVYSMLGYMLPGGVWTIMARGFLSKGEDRRKTPLMVMAGIVETILTGIAALFLCIIFLSIQSWSFSLPLIVPLIVGILFIYILEPKNFTKLSARFFKLSNNDAHTHFQYNFINLLMWFLGEFLVVLIGSLALFVLLSSFLRVNIQHFALIVIGWSFAVAISSLFFWLPGTPFIRDGTMVGILSTKMTAGFAVIFVIVQRLWSIITILLFSVVLWFIYDFPTLLSKFKN